MSELKDRLIDPLEYLTNEEGRRLGEFVKYKKIGLLGTAGDVAVDALIKLARERYKLSLIKQLVAKFPEDAIANLVTSLVLDTPQGQEAGDE